MSNVAEPELVGGGGILERLAGQVPGRTLDSADRGRVLGKDAVVGGVRVAISEITPKPTEW